jgi:hypothetical protein
VHVDREPPELLGPTLESMHKNIGIVPLELLLIENGECSKLITKQ